jgi:hypothetical protein
MWKGVEKSEKFSIATLALCIVALAVVVLFRLF